MYKLINKLEHIIHNNFSNDFNRTWCKECQRNTIEDAHILAKENGFIFLSEEYINADSTYLWKCIKRGHEWRTTYSNIYNRKKCPKCNRHFLFKFTHFKNILLMMTAINHGSCT